MIEINVVHKFIEFQRLESSWNAVLEGQHSEDMVFSRHEWFDCWWRAFSKGASLYVVVAKDRERVVGIAPLMMRKVFVRGLPVRLLTFIENGNSLHNNFIVDNARRSEVIQAIVGYLVSVSREWDMLELKNIPEDSSNLQVLRDVLRRNGILFAEKEGLNSPYLKIGSDWESFFKNRSGKSRKTLRNIQNRFSRHANYSIQNITDLADYEKMKPQLYDISSNSWTEEIGDSLNSPANRSFFDRLSRVSAAQGWLIIWLLQFNDEPIAFEYHLKYNGKVNGLRASYKKTYSNMSPGVFLDSYIIEHLFGSKDIEEYDMGGDPDFYKRKWTNDCRQHATVNIFTRGAYSRLIHTYEHRLIPIIKHAVRRSR